MKTKRVVVLMMTLLILSCGSVKVHAGKYIYYDEDGNRVDYLPSPGVTNDVNNAQKKTTQKTRSVKRAVSVRDTYEQAEDMPDPFRGASLQRLSGKSVIKEAEE
ncbi:MAG: hypothetical protein EOL87_09465 [Spartobacteria bacterium]|nr:hypothetical protein [Spartobacteria bacterium]